MHEVVIRPLSESEVPLSRRLYARSPDREAMYLVERLPHFFDIADFLDPVGPYVARQLFVLGAFREDLLIGTVAVEKTSLSRNADIGEIGTDALLRRFSEHDILVYSTLAIAHRRIFIGAPEASLYIHSLSVDESRRRIGIATQLIRTAIELLNDQQRLSLYMEVPRLKWVQRWGESLGFRPLRKTLSLSQRLEFGCWGHVLMRYIQS